MDAVHVACRLADEFDTSSMRLPAAEYLPANMYHDLWSPARILLPSKVVEETRGERATTDTCLLYTSPSPRD